LQVEYNGNQIYTYNLLTGASTEAGADSAYLPSDLP